ncbi:MAG: hypothetical protein V7731_19980 [Amphritea sp.]
MHNLNTPIEDHDHSARPRDYNFRSAVAEQQEMITQQTADSELNQHSPVKDDQSANDFSAIR